MDININNDADVCGAMVTYDDPDVILPFENAVLVDGLPSGSLFPIGSTMQTYQASDASGNIVSCSFNVNVHDVSPDSDCDGVSDACDVCDGGDDSIDADGDGQPDCLNLPDLIDPSWSCSNNSKNKKYFICHNPQGNSNTLCVSENAISAHMAHGDFLGPCTSCTASRLAGSDHDAYSDHDAHLNVYPQPASDVLQVECIGLQKGDASLKIVNSIGKTVWEESIYISDFSSQLNIKLDEKYLNGVYIVVVKQTNLTLTKPITIIKS